MKLRILITFALILFLTQYSQVLSSKTKLKSHTRGWTWNNLGGSLRDIAVNSFNRIGAIDRYGRPVGFDVLSHKWRLYPGGRRNAQAVAFANDNTLYICRGNIIEKFVPFHSDRFHGRWQRINGCCRDISVGSNGFLAVIGCDNHRYGFGVWRYIGRNKWAKMSGEATRIDVGPRGQIGVINRSYSVFFRYSYRSNWYPINSVRGFDITITNTAGIIVVGTNHRLYFSSGLSHRPRFTYNPMQANKVSSWSWRRPFVIGIDGRLRQGSV